MILVFLVGVAVFALHKAVLESGHPMIGDLPAALRTGGGALSLGLEFIVLIVALTLVRSGQGWAAAVYAAYGALNCLGGWLILTRRI